jgi:hypothetical protein
LVPINPDRWLTWMVIDEYVGNCSCRTGTSWMATRSCIQIPLVVRVITPLLTQIQDSLHGAPIPNEGRFLQYQLKG